MKKILCLIMSLLLITLMATGASAVVYGEAGYETEGDSEATAWEIPSAKVLKQVRDDVNNGKFKDSYPYFRVTKDISITDETDWNPIGCGNTSIYKDFPFNGVFDGDGHTIKVKISKFGYNNYAGLFGHVNGGTIKNLSVEGTIAYHEVLGTGAAGGIACHLHSGTIQKCTFDGYISIQGSQEYSGLRNPAGGIVARTDGNTFKILNCKVGSKQETTMHAVNNQGTGSGGIVAIFNDTSTSTQLVGNYAKVRFTGSHSKQGGTYAERSGFKGTVANNTYVDPDDPEEDPEEPDPEELEIEADFETNWTIKKAYTAIAEAKGGTAPYKWTKSGTATWLKLKNTTGSQVTLVGTPTEAGTFTAKIKVTDANSQSVTKSFKITISSPSITGTFKAGVIKTSYSGSATVSGGMAPYTWTKSGVPAGLTFKISGTDKDKVTLTGKPTTAGTYTFKITAKDKNKVSASKTFSIKITKPAISGTFKAGVIKTSYSGSATVSGGTAPYTWTKSGVPAGLTFKISGTNKNKITLTGKPTTAKNYSFKVTAKDKNGVSVSKTFSIIITKPAISGTFKEGIIKTSYSGSATVTGGTAPYTWTKSGVPAGLTFKISGTNKDKVTLTGKPTTAKNYSFKVTAKDKNGVSVSKTFAINIKSQLTISGSFEEGFLNEYYSSNIKVSGGTTPYTWKKSGTLPTGLKMSKNSTGTTFKLAGTPSKAGDFTFTLTVTDAAGLSISKTYNMTISEESFEEEEEFEELGSASLKSKADNFPQIFNAVNAYKDSDKQTVNKFFSIAVTELKVSSDDVIWQGEGRDEDLIEVKAGKPVNFIIGEWLNSNGEKVSINAEDIYIYVDDKLIENIEASEDGKFVIPAEFVHDDFKVKAKADELETVELFISAVE